MKMTFKTLISLLTLILIASLNFACTGNSTEGTKLLKTTGTGSNEGSFQKPDSKVGQAALDNKVFIWPQMQKSEIKAANLENVIYATLLAINGKPCEWRLNFKIKTDEIISDIAAPGECDLEDNKLELTLQAKRIKKSDKAADKGVLVLAYTLENLRATDAKAAKSLLLVGLDLNLTKGPKLYKAVELVYPLSDDFSLDEWIDKKIK